MPFSISFSSNPVLICHIIEMSFFLEYMKKGNSCKNLLLKFLKNKIGIGSYWKKIDQVKK